MGCRTPSRVDSDREGEEKRPWRNSCRISLPSWRSLPTYLSFGRNGHWLRELELQLALGREKGYVLVGLGLVGIFGIAFGRAVRSSNRIGFQIVGLPVDYDRSERHLQFVLFDLDDAAGYLRTLGNHGLPLHLNRRGEACGKDVTDLVLVASERLAYRRADLRAFRHCDHRRWLRCFVCCCGRLWRIGFLGSGSGFAGSGVGAARDSKNSCRCQREP